MSAKAISEATGKSLLVKHLSIPNNALVKPKFVTIDEHTDLHRLPDEHPWLSVERLVVKPDQLIKRRGKLGLIHVNSDYQGVKEWVEARRGKDVAVGKAHGKLRNFIIEPFVPHQPNEEYYLAIFSHRNGDTIMFTTEGGVDVGDVDSKALRVEVATGEKPTASDIQAKLLSNVPAGVQTILSEFIFGIYNLYVDLFFTYLEINPLVVSSNRVYILDLAAKLDATADFMAHSKWGKVDFPPPFGRDAYPEEAFIADLDAKSGASLKLTVLNPKGRIWTMVAGGGASVIYADTICDLGGSAELANYGEYSGAPTEHQTYEYAKTILTLMTKEHHPEGKVLIIGGGIANFTNVAATFSGIVQALKEFKVPIIEYNIIIYVRRGGPNYQEGLRVMRETGQELGIPIHVYGPETHMTAVVAYALKYKSSPAPAPPTFSTANFLLPGGITGDQTPEPKSRSSSSTKGPEENQFFQKVGTFVGKTLGLVNGDGVSVKDYTLFSRTTKAMIWGMQPKAVQEMLDFDFVCSRREPSVACMVYPFVGNHKQKFYWGHKEILLPMWRNLGEAMKNHPEVDVVVNFASLRSAYDATLEIMQYPQIRTIAIIAEGIPENLTREMNRIAKKKGINIIGPATVGGIKPGCFKIGNTGGMLDNILSSKLYRPGSVAYVSRSGGMSNELNNIVSRASDGVYEGIAIGGDRYPGTTFIDHIFRYQLDPEIKMIVLLGEVGGVEEYEICNAIKTGKITKPVVAWCIGTCASMFSSEVQFGHAGACANAEKETAVAKNTALREAGAVVPRSFDELGENIREVYNSLVANGTIVPAPDTPPPPVPMDYAWARELGLIRKPASFMTSICDERGQELLYAGIPISDILKEDMGVGGVLSLLWFQRRLPPYAAKFLEMCLIVTADHGPAVSGAHNTIVTARAGKDLVSSLCSGLLTIGDRFGGALDDAARMFSEAYDSGQSPMDFVNETKKKGQTIMGIGHRVKSINNPDMRIVLLRDYVKKHFPATPVLDFAFEVEKITTKKKPNLILNVDGFIAVSFLDLFRSSGCFTREEANEYVEIGILNGIFVLGRSMGFIGHYLDQRRLKQGLYRHPWDDISYVMPEASFSGKTDGI
ncbi:ATP-citrate synthase-like [Paramacrobiotus metropolitanus]|uniref:ATP-citrate synthase-like n=1 Tax=Paramacrobiotus metropolitanus TaxID=2943436 RepID=UPI002445D08F|nr:ATP-citrate synthase-like [Paramacrobiotus metropolitanus]XP_055346990.1 ATP-citrate synthase-like [Paramacrobiotus metropolitanus]XP_055346993.1 ATP-citrate synthase-like [Paramacrobiotus metropolitanus]